MPKIDFHNDWTYLRSRLKEKYTHLTEDDLTWEAGKEEDLYERLQNRLSLTREQLVNTFSNLMKNKS